MARKRVSESEPTKDNDDGDLHAMLPVPKRTKAHRAWEKVAKSFEAWRPACEELTLVRSVPTRFVQLDRATRCGGFPIERITTVHGPSSHGKTELCLGLLDSFLTLDHGANLIDAEFTTPFDWCERLMGSNARHPAFVAQRPDNCEATVNAVRAYVKSVAKARDDGLLPEDTAALIVVDSVRKLIPKGLMDDVMKVAKTDKAVDMLTGRSGQQKAQVVQAWLDELVPLMGRNQMAIVMIARETDKEGADADDRKYDQAWAVAGTKGLIFDASLVMRVTRSGYVYDPPSGENRVVIGERHKVRIWKTKVESKEGKFTDAYFHTSNGVYQPYGFDRARDVLELAVHYGIVEQGGSWFSYDGKRLGQGENKVCRLLNDATGTLEEIEALVRARFSPDEELPGGEGDGQDD
jgi:recombination protein RecA